MIETQYCQHQSGKGARIGQITQQCSGGRGFRFAPALTFSLYFYVAVKIKKHMKTHIKYAITGLLTVACLAMLNRMLHEIIGLESNILFIIPVIIGTVSGIIISVYHGRTLDAKEKTRQILSDSYEREKFIRHAFQKYVPENVVSELIDSPDGTDMFKTDRKTVTILFADIRNFTTFSEKNSTDYCVKMLNGYFVVLTNIIIENNGYVDKFIGDAVMAVFDDPDSAVLAGLQIKRKEHHLTFSVSIGINTGRVIIGNIGCVHKMDYTVTGDAVNIASRIQELSKNYANMLLISEYTKHELKNKYILNDSGNHTLKGKSQKVRIFKLHALH